MHLGTAQTVGNQSIGVYTDPKKDPRSKYCFIFENELEIVGEVAKKILIIRGNEEILTKRVWS